MTGCDAPRHAAGDAVTPNTPSPSASVFIAFVQAQPLDEPAATRRTRQALTCWTLTRLRAQFGDALELTVVELFDVALDEERDLAPES